MKRGRALMIQGTASYAGKTALVAALCRILAQAGLSVAPFKAQNMSLNSYVTMDGGEIARAQAFQAFAAGIEPRVEMNPILLKPKGGMVSQVVVLGKVHGDISAASYYGEFAMKDGLRAVRKSLDTLLSEFEAVVIEGAGSPAEINLYDQEIANMRAARLADAPVFLVADIERGGVFASLVGTISLLKKDDRERVKGIIINKFRGDPRVLEPGLRKMQALTRKPVLGVMPYIENLDLPWEDSVSLGDLTAGISKEGIDVAVIRLPFVSNFTDLHPLKVAGMNVRLVKSRDALGVPDVLIIPGTKNTVHDLEWLRREGLDEEVRRLRRSGVPIIGICGGYQMLGRKLADPLGLEAGTAGAAEYEGLGLLDVVTRFERHTKRTLRAIAEITGTGPILGKIAGTRIRVYEIHMGETEPGKERSPFRIIPADARGGSPHPDGAISDDGLVFGSHLHGLFDDGTITRALLGYVMGDRGRIRVAGTGTKIEKTWEHSLDLLCDTLRSNVDLERILRIAQIRAEKVSVSCKTSK